MAGVPVQSADVSEKVLSDIRQTIAELLVDNFYGTMAKLAHEKGCEFTAESVAPTMVSDGMLHYSKADIPMGEFWFAALRMISLMICWMRYRGGTSMVKILSRPRHLPS
jgi:hypothetical protein